jgi:4-hydroxy-3-methylbut-2-enyl diphosphate reductase IspH
MADVLCVGIDDAAMQTRRLILEKAGHVVSQARDLRRVKEACDANSFSIVILGQALNASEKRRISDVVLTHCKSAKILELHTSITPDVPEADEHLQVSATEPESLIEAVDGLLRTRRKQKTLKQPSRC